MVSILEKNIKNNIFDASTTPNNFKKFLQFFPNLLWEENWDFFFFFYILIASQKIDIKTLASLWDTWIPNHIDLFSISRGKQAPATSLQVPQL